MDRNVLGMEPGLTNQLFYPMVQTFLAMLCAAVPVWKDSGYSFPVAEGRTGDRGKKLSEPP
jgi:hypothetical protein